MPVSVRGKFPITPANLNLNASKTGLVLFTRKHSIPKVMEPLLNCTRLTIRDKGSYLGLSLDRKL